MNLAQKHNDEFGLERGESANLKFQLIPNVNIFTLKAYILEKVDTGQYSEAVETLKRHLEGDYPYKTYKDKVQNSVLLAIELINSIENNTNFPGLSLMPKTKRQEIRDKNGKMREDLKKILEGVIKVYSHFKNHDDRSTVYLIRTIWFSILFFGILVISLDVKNDHFGSQLIRTAEVVASWAANKVVNLF